MGARRDLLCLIRLVDLPAGRPGSLRYSLQFIFITKEVSRTFADGGKMTKLATAAEPDDVRH